MSIIQHASQAFHLTPRTKSQSRLLVTQENGATNSNIWEQFLPPAAVIKAHYHDVEESVILLDGVALVVIENESAQIETPATIFLPAQSVHSFTNVGTCPLHSLAFFPSIRPATWYLDILALHEAIKQGDLATAKQLLTDDPFIANSYLPDNGDRPLHIAVRQNNLEMVKLLLAFGARKTEVNHAGETPLALIQAVESQMLAVMSL